MNPLIALVRSNALYWWSYRAWQMGDPEKRGWEMHKAMRDIVLYAALYRVQRKRELNIR